MEIKNQFIEYNHNDTTLEGFIAYDVNQSRPLPGVLIAHMWGGREQFVEKKANELAELGYVGFAIDMYGKGVKGTSVEENSRLMKPFIEDRIFLQERIKTGLEVLKNQEIVNSSKLAGIGFCFGGLCVLDLARTGIDINGIISFHGLLNPPPNLTDTKIKSKVLVIHGDSDPMAPPKDIQRLREELNRKHADWQIHIYGNTVHAFTNPNANDPKRGTVYKEIANIRSLETMKNFLREIFI